MTFNKAAALSLSLIVFSATAQAEETKKGFFRHPLGNGELTLSGRIHWVLMQVDDGAEQTQVLAPSGARRIPPAGSMPIQQLVRFSCSQ